MKKGIVLQRVFAVLLLLVSSVQFVQARHKCYKVPAPPGIVGIISIPILIPFGSTMAAARSSETSGCDGGHPSENFYKPKNKRVALFLKDNFLQVREESAQGQGLHLDALAQLAGCSIEHTKFGRIIQNNYSHIFGADFLSQNADNPENITKRTTERFLGLMADSPLLASSCESG
ncbi:MAG: DUF3015 family protein [SAR324 cluster bacterium]|nr:DUF3015 family protein [SAR324 cluster bacterium]